jgi:hypothetical protein
MVSPGDNSAARPVRTNGAATRLAVTALEARRKSRRDVAEEISWFMCLGRCERLFHQKNVETMPQFSASIV